MSSVTEKGVAGHATNVKSGLHGPKHDVLPGLLSQQQWRSPAAGGLLWALGMSPSAAGRNWWGTAGLPRAPKPRGTIRGQTPSRRRMCRRRLNSHASLRNIECNGHPVAPSCSFKKHHGTKAAVWGCFISTRQPLKPCCLGTAIPKNNTPSSQG